MTDSTVPLSQPLYGANIGQAVSRFFRKYATFSGRASRGEFWWVWVALVLVNLVLVIVFAFTMSATGTPNEMGGLNPSGAGIAVLVVWGIIELAIIVPTIALSVRRLHDANFAGWWYLLHLTSVGGMVVLVLNLLPSNPTGARFDR